MQLPLNRIKKYFYQSNLVRSLKLVTKKYIVPVMPQQPALLRPSRQIGAIGCGF